MRRAIQFVLFTPLFVLCGLILYSCSESWAKPANSKERLEPNRRDPFLYNCSIIARSDYWALFEVKTKDCDYLILDSESGIQIIKK